MATALLAASCQKKESYSYTNTYQAPQPPSEPTLLVSGDEYIMSPLTFSVQAHNLQYVTWSFGDNKISTSNIAIHEYYEPKAYTVTARVTTSDSTFTLSHKLNITLGTERLSRMRSWNVTHIYLDSTVRHNGPSAPNPTLKFNYKNNLALNIKSEHEVWLPENTFFSYGISYATHVYTDTQSEYIWYRAEMAVNTAIDVAYYYQKDSASIFIRNPEMSKNSSRPYGQYYGIYHTTAKQ